jgi:hypothetical protein
MTKLWVRRLLIVIPLVVATFVAFVYFLLWPFAVEMATQARLLPGIERRIGAKICAPEVSVGGHLLEVITFAEVVPGAPCSRAGIASGDIIASDQLIGSLCKRLQLPTGTRVVVEVVPGGPGPTIAERPKRRAVIVLP